MAAFAKIDTMLDDIFREYKPFRNALRQLNLIDSLYVIRAFHLYITGTQKLPEDIESGGVFDGEFKNEMSVFIEGSRLIVLYREVIVNAEKYIVHGHAYYSYRSLRKYRHMASAIDKLNFLDGLIAEKYITQNNIRLELIRMAHRQFPWQSQRTNPQMILRFFKIFSDEKLNKALLECTGMDTAQLFAISFLFYAHYLKQGFIENITDDMYELMDIPKEIFQMYFDRFSKDSDALRAQLRERQQLNEKFFHNYETLFDYPVVKINSAYYCPILQLFMWRITGGLYYDLIKYFEKSRDTNFGNIFGSAYQDYIGEVLDAANKTKKYALLPEKRYAIGKDSVDWILGEKSESVFIECKAKRMTSPAKSELLTTTSLEKDLDKLCEGILETYKTYSDYKKNLYPHLPYSQSRKVYINLVTLEEWYLISPDLHEKVISGAISKIRAAGIDSGLLDEAPFFICSAQDFEFMMQIIDMVGIAAFYGSLFEKREKGRLATYNDAIRLFNKEQNKTDALFKEDLDKIFPEKIRGKLKNL